MLLWCILSLQYQCDVHLVDVAGHDADLAGSGGDDAGAVGTDQARLALAEQRVLHLDHVLLGDTCRNMLLYRRKAKFSLK